MLLRIALIIMTLMVLISTSAFAATSKKGEKDTSVALRGESKVGDGYKLFFDKKKKSSLHVHGFTRLYMYFTEDPDKNLRMPYFRFYVDGQKDEHWAFHSRFDYRQGHFSNSNSGALSNANGGTTPGIYFARAYTTYTYNENFKIDAGRNINFHHKYDVLALAELEVGLGFFPRFKYGNFSFDMSYIYMDESQRMSPADEPEASYYGGRVSYSVKASKDFKIDMGLGFNGSHMEDVAEYRQFTPDLTFNLPCDSWILNQFMWRKYTDNIKPVIENYIEIGKDFSEKVSADIYFVYQKNGTAESVHEIGFEYYYKFTKAFMIVGIADISGIRADSDRDRSYNLKSIIEYKF